MADDGLSRDITDYGEMVRRLNAIAAHNIGQVPHGAAAMANSPVVDTMQRLHDARRQAMQTPQPPELWSKGPAFNDLLADQGNTRPLLPMERFGLQRAPYMAPGALPPLANPMPNRGQPMPGGVTYSPPREGLY